jgi:hypothetical protein
METRYLLLPATFLDFHGDPRRKNNRAVLIDWMVEVAVSFRISEDAFFMSIAILDSYLSKTNVTTDSLQILGAACLFIAEKFHDVEANVSHVKDYVWVGDGAFDNSKFLHMEIEVLKTLDWDIWFGTLLSGYKEYKLETPISLYEDWLVRQTLEKCLYGVEMYHYPFPRLIEAALYLFSSWKPSSSEEDYAQEISFLYSMLEKMEKSTLKGTLKKYNLLKKEQDWVFPKVK